MAVLFSGGCVLFLRPTTSPIPTRWVYDSSSERTDSLVVFLPGRHDRIEDLEKTGIVAEMSAAGVQADVVAVDAHLAYYFNRSIDDRLREDVLEPARAMGYNRIVVVGASLGGMGAFLAEELNPGYNDAMVLFGPYLGGNDKLFGEIEAAGGPRKWASLRTPKPGDPDEKLWSFIGGNLDALPPTWLGYSTDDYLRSGQDLLASVLAEDRVEVIAGGHDWETWRKLWRGWCLESELFVDERAESHRIASN